jgi:hypothetical protein
MASFVCLSLVLTLSYGFIVASPRRPAPELPVMRVTMGGSDYPPLLVEVRGAVWLGQ